MGDYARCGDCGLLLCDCKEGPLEPTDPLFPIAQMVGDGWMVFPCQRCGGCDGSCRSKEDDEID
jgi:hypothetical protein